MKKFLVISLMIALVTGLIFSGCAQAPAPAPKPAPAPAPAPAPKPSPAPQEKFNLSFTTYWPEPSTQWKGSYKPVLDEIQQKSNGRITFTTYLGGALGGGDEIYDIVRTGKADMGATGHAYTPGRFPLIDVFTLPGAFESSKAAAEASLAVFDRILNREYPDTHCLAIQQTQTFYLYTAKKPLRVLEDMKGLKVRSVGGVGTQSLEALGAKGIQMPLGDVYLSLQTGVVDGSVTGPTALPGFKLDEVLRHVLKFPISHGSNMIVMNRNTWSKIPDDLKKIAEEAARKFA